MLAAIAGVAASAIAFAASTGLGVFWPLAWLAPVPVLVLAFCRPRRSAALLAFLAYFLGNLSLLRLFRTGGLIIFAGPPSIAFAIAVLAARAAIGRMPPWQAALVFPSVFTAYEFLYSSISLNGTYWSVGYSQTDVLPLLQIVSLTGLWGVIFLMTFLPSAMAVAWHRRTAWVLTPALGSLLVALGFGAVRLWRAPDSVSVRAGVFAADQVVPVADGSDVTPTVRLARAYAAGIARMASERAEIVVMPEKLVGMSPEDTEAVTRVFSDASRAARVTAIVGLSRMGATQRHNVAVVFGPGGEMVAEYKSTIWCPSLKVTSRAATHRVSSPGRARNGAWPSARTWIFPAGRVSMGGEACASWRCRRWTSSATAACTPGWLSPGASRTVLRSPALLDKAS